MVIVPEESPTPVLVAEELSAPVIVPRTHEVGTAENREPRTQNLQRPRKRRKPADAMKNSYNELVKSNNNIARSINNIARALNNIAKKCRLLYY